MNIQKQKTGKQVFDKTGYIRQLQMLGAGMMAIVDNEGNFIRYLSENDMAGLNNSLMTKFNQAGNEESLKAFTKAIDEAVWPVSVTTGDMPDWVTKFNDFLQSIGMLGLIPYEINPSSTEKTRQRLWQIPLPLDKTFFGAMLERGLDDYITGNGLKTSIKDYEIDEQLDVKRLTVWVVQVAITRSDK
jgi:hypothetical protein